MADSSEHIVVIGASAGGVGALLEICEALPARFPAPVCIVQHIGPGPSLLPELLRFRGPNAAVHPHDGEPLRPGILYVAPPDRHLLVDGDRVRLTHGPKENHARPAIDPLFRSAALAFGPRCIGVILTGQMDDGTAGLQAIKECGGTAIVQDPKTALESSMPLSALRHVAVDHIVPLAEMASLLARLTADAPPVPSAPVPDHVAREVAINRGAATVENLKTFAKPSPLTCPDCGGGLWEVEESRPLRYRCHTGHAYTAMSLADAQKAASEETLWSSVRAVRERQILLRRVAGIAASMNEKAQAAAAEAEADRLQAQVEQLQQLAQAEAAVPPDADAA